MSCGQSELWEVVEIENPSGNNSGESSLHVDESGKVYLSWIDIKDDSISALQYAPLGSEKFDEPITIASGTDWFVNWADFPSLVRYPDSKKLLAHWLQKSDQGTYDYDVRISTSDGSGKRWSSSQILHDDGVAAEHGFVSITPYKYKLLAVWLDGRNMTKAETKDGGGHDHGHGGGAMTLRCAMIDVDNSITRRIELDNQVCECCQTDVAICDDGPIVVYRNKSELGIRDIYYTRGIGEDWTIPKPIFEDDWKISGCPVNGPRVDARGSNVAIAWYSGADQKVKTRYSSDCGATFSDPIIVNEDETLGRVDLQYINEEEYVVSYMESRGEFVDIKIRKVSHVTEIDEPKLIGETSASRSSGFPRLAASNDELYVSYTYVDSTYQRVVTKSLSI